MRIREVISSGVEVYEKPVLAGQSLRTETYLLQQAT